MPKRRMLSMMRRRRRVLLQMLLLLELSSTVTGMTIGTTLRGGGSECPALGVSGTVWKGKYTGLWWHFQGPSSSFALMCG